MIIEDFLYLRIVEILEKCCVSNENTLEKCMEQV